MKYRARIEKLDWRGNVIVSFREYEDEFEPKTFEALEDFVKTGKLKTSLLGDPKTSVWDIRRKIAPQRSKNSFDEWEPGLRVIASEHMVSAGAQYLIYDQSGDGKCNKWVETDVDMVGKERG